MFPLQFSRAGLDRTLFSLEIFGFVMLSGAVCTLLLPEPRGRSLEELSNESQKGFIRSTIFSKPRKGDSIDGTYRI